MRYTEPMDEERSTDASKTPTKRTRSPRDPAGRRHAIAQAAADVILEEGPAKLTHRKAAERAGVPLGSTTQYFSSIEDLRLAGMQLLAQEFDASVDEFAEELKACGTDAEALVHAFRDYLSDADQVQRDAMLTAAAGAHPAIRELAAASDDRMLNIAIPRLGEKRTWALWMLADGFTTYAYLHGDPPDDEVMRFAIERILS